MQMASSAPTSLADSGLNVCIRSSSITHACSARLGRLQVAARRRCVLATAMPPQASSGPDDYLIAIPSYDRWHTLRQNTLPALRRAGIDTGARVHIFVADAAEAAMYRQTLEPGSYRCIVQGTQLVSIARQRDAILDHFGGGANVVQVDDDIVRFVNGAHEDWQLDLHEAILTGFDLSRQHGCYMWGVNNASNKLFTRPTFSVGWCFFQGPFMAFRVREGVRLQPTFTHDILEDVAFSLMHCKLDGAVLRLNGIGLKARPYKTEPGGIQSCMSRQQRVDTSIAARKDVTARWGKFIRDWDPDKHPALRRSPSHRVEQLSFGGGQ